VHSSARVVRLRLRGETYLKINFLSYGVRGQTPQTYGNQGMMIPDGLHGRHQMHNEEWEFKVRHVQQDSETSNICIEFTLINLTTKIQISKMETELQASNRRLSGECAVPNEVLHQALQISVNELERSMFEVEDVPENRSRKSLMRSKQSRSFSDGMLAFGLLHQCVQDNLL
jgi:hypothetical protein